MRNRDNRKGFVLLMTLAIIAISGLLLVGIANQGLNLVAEAGTFERDLQIKWGTASCQRYVLANTDELLTQRIETTEAEGVSTRAIPNSACEVELGGFSFWIMAIDESAKLDVNLLTAKRSLAESTSTVRELAQGPWKAALRPLPADKQRDAKEGSFECWEQVFDMGSAFQTEQYLQATSQLTCWSTKMCLQSASDQALQAMAELFVGPAAARTLVDLRNDHPGADVDSLLGKLNVRPSEIDSLRRLFTNQSFAQSVLVQVRGEGRNVTRLFVREPIGPGLDRFCGFAW